MNIEEIVKNQQLPHALLQHQTKIDLAGFTNRFFPHMERKLGLIRRFLK